MSHVAALIRQTSKERGLAAERKADNLLKYLLDGGKISEIVCVAEYSFMNSVLKTDKIVRRLDGISVPIQVKSSPTPGIAFTEFLTKHIGDNWAYPLILVFPPESGWEKMVPKALRQINSWLGNFKYEDWQLEYSPYLDFSKFKIFGRSIQLRVESFLEARADLSKAEEHKRLDEERRKKVLEERRKRKYRQKRKWRKIEIAPRADHGIWNYDPIEEEKISQTFEKLKQSGRVVYFFKTHPYSWLALVWRTDVVVKRSDGVLVPIRIRGSRAIVENETTKTLNDFFEKNCGAAPLFCGADNPDLDKIGTWSGNFAYADWMVEEESYFDSNQFQGWDLRVRTISFLNLKWLKYGVAEEILHAAGIKTHRDKNGILFLD